MFPRPSPSNTYKCKLYISTKLQTANLSIVLQANIFNNEEYVRKHFVRFIKSDLMYVQCAHHSV